jgi:chromosome segregation ATPase
MVKETDMVIALPYGKDVVIKVVRHVSNIIIMTSEEQQFACQMTFENNVSRDIFTVLVRNLNKKFNETSDQVRLLSERDFYKKKEELWQKQVDSLNHELTEARQRAEEYDLMEQKYQSAADLVKELSDMLERQKSRESEALEQYSTLQQDVNFYRQEAAIFETRNAKLVKKLAKLKERKKSATVST